MNDNLRELVFKAHTLCEKKTYGWQRNPGELYEKIAELVALECVAICDAYGMPDGTSPVAEILAATIKSRFGIK